MRSRLVLGLVALILLGVGAGVWPHVRAIRALEERREDLQARAAASDDGAATLTRLQTELEEATRLAEERSKPISAQSDVAEMIRALTAQLDRLGMSEREITTGAPTHLPDAASLPMSVRMKGRFPNVHEAIRWIESLPRLVRAKRVSIEIPRRRSDKNNVDWLAPEVDAELLLDVFFAPVGEAAPPSGSATAAAQESE